MKHTLYAIIAACLAMLATSGIVALATAAPAPTPLEAVEPAAVSPEAEAQLVAHLDGVIAQRLRDIKHRMIVDGAPR